MICTFAMFEEKIHGHRAGGKGRVLARLFQLDYPIPNGFILFPEAFGDDGIGATSWRAVLNQYRKLTADGTKVAVRSSAFVEDSASASFAGEFETVLNIDSEEALSKAIQKVFDSKDSERVRAYSKEKGLDEDLFMAIIIQCMVDAEFAGVLFTIDPVKNDTSLMTGNLVKGLGEKLVSGETTGTPFSYNKDSGEVITPEYFSSHSDDLFRIATRLEADLDTPQDIEWAVADNKVFILQSRPITTINTTHEIWNDSLKHDYLWTNTNWGEAISSVMSPLYFSMIKYNYSPPLPGDHQFLGNIGGRMYMNFSIIYSIASKLGQPPKKAMKISEDTLGKLPEGITLPLMELSWTATLKLIGTQIWWRINRPQLKRHTKWMLEDSEQWCEDARKQIKQLSTVDAFKAQVSEIEKILTLNYRCLFFYSIKFNQNRAQTKAVLEKNLNAADIETLLTGLEGDAYLESMGPLFGITDVINGHLSREDFIRKHGHRGPEEGEISIPRPGEDLKWIDRLIDEWQSQGDKLSEMMAVQKAKREAIWDFLRSKSARKYSKLKKMVETTTYFSQKREQLKSESARYYWVIRMLMLKVGEFYGLGEDIFFLTIDEVKDLLNGGVIDRERVAMRKESSQIYKALPPLPNIISGQIDPEQWAKNPNRRVDFYDSHVSVQVDEEELIRGFPGASGVVEGIVRVLHSYEQSSQFKEGEILVASFTNVGWTPIFPRAAAIITDIGAPVSHAAIVAREMGIPAVVGTGNATDRLKTGDQVKVIGEKGIVEILKKSEVNQGS